METHASARERGRSRSARYANDVNANDGGLTASVELELVLVDVGRTRTQKWSNAIDVFDDGDRFYT